jgi:ATP-dependent protease ClpP protease subunit
MAKKIYLYGPIGEDVFGDGVSAISIVEQLRAADGADVALHINSPGGSVFEGHAMFNAIASYDGRVDVYIDGLAASAASIVALAGDSVHAAKNALLMIHEPWAVVVGTSDDMLQMADLLDKMSGTLLDIYAGKASVDRDILAASMAAETWLTAAEALEWGLVDEVIDSAARVAALGSKEIKAFGYKNTPAEIVQKDTTTSPDEQPAAEYAEETQQEESSRLSVHTARLNLLKRKY